MAKKRAFVKYTKQGRLIPGSLIVTTNGGYPVDGLYTEVPINICCDTDIPGTITTSPKGWVRYTKKGAIVPGSLVVGKSHPKDGVWKEVTIDLCCNTDTGSNWYLRQVFDFAVNPGDITFPDYSDGTGSLNPNLVGDFSGGPLVQLYINLFDIQGVDRTVLLSQLIGNTGTLTLTQGGNSVTYGYTTQTFFTTSNAIAFDVFVSSPVFSLTLVSPASGDFNTTDPIEISIVSVPPPTTTTTTTIAPVILPSVPIGPQIWTSGNLDVTTYRNGDPIPEVQDQATWDSLTTGAWCYYNNDPATGAVYGKLYNWYAVNDPRGLAPQGWHVPTDAEWQTLYGTNGNNATLGGRLKEVGTTHWTAPNVGATDQYGFTALPGGYRGNSIFNQLTIGAFYWSATQFLGNNAYYKYILNSTAIAFAGSGVYDIKTSGFSIRLIKD